MSLRDCELDVARLLEAAGLGSLADGLPTLYAGPYSEASPDALIACRQSSAERPEKYLGAVGLALHRPTVTVLVRGARGLANYTESGERARAAWAALYDRTDIAEYIRIDCEDGAPTYLGEDEEQRPRWSFTVTCEYVTASAGGVVVPLDRTTALRVGGLEVAGDARVSGLLALGALPFASFPSPTTRRGALLFDSDAGLLRVSDGTTWLPLGAPSPAPTAATVPVTPAGELAATSVQAALEELQEDVSSRAAQSSLSALATAVLGKASQLALDALTAVVGAKASQSALDALATLVGTKADASALTAHATSTAAHGVAQLVGLSEVQTLSNKKHSGLLEVTSTAADVVALRIPFRSRFSFGPDGTNADSWLALDGQGYLQSNRFFRAPILQAGAGLAQESAAFATDDGARWQVARNGRVRRLSGDTSSTSGNATANAFRGKSTIAAGASSVTITNNLVLATTMVRAQVMQAAEDATLKSVVRTSIPTAGGSLTVYGNAPATSPVVVTWELFD